jgi:hypothetical protein
MKYLKVMPKNINNKTIEMMQKEPKPATTTMTSNKIAS